MTDKQNYFTYTDNTSDNNDKIMENLHKQIIIDGCDVSECCAFSKHREGYCGWYTPCEGDSCSYKLDWALDQLKRKEQECERLKKANKHIEHNRNQKADKLMRIEKLITACSTGYTDDFIQSILAILLEAELTEE